MTLTGEEGKVVIRASQRGNDQFNAASIVDRRFEVIAPPTIPSILINRPANGTSFIENTIDIEYTLFGDLQFHEANHLLISVNNQTAIDVHTLNGTYALNNLSEGAYAVKLQLADNNHLPFSNPEATAIINFSIIPSEKEQTIAFSSIPNKLTTDSPFQISASASSSLPVNFEIQSGPATINGNTITLSGMSGDVTVKASQNGNEAYKSANEIFQSFSVTEPTTVEQLSQSITFPAIPNKYTNDEPFEVEVSASSGLPVSLSIESGPASVTGKIVRLNGTAGTVIIRARQAGNEQYKRAISFGRSFTVTEKIRQNQSINFPVVPNNQPMQNLLR